MASKRKVYVVLVDNGEDYEDNHVWIEAIFASRKKAEQYLTDNQWVKLEPQTFWHKEESHYGWKVVRSAEIEKHYVS